jgi:gamma-glutamyltranspeptidase
MVYKMGHNSSQAIQVLEAERRAYADRSYLGDPDFVKNNFERFNGQLP